MLLHLALVVRDHHAHVAVVSSSRPCLYRGEPVLDFISGVGAHMAARSDESSESLTKLAGYEPIYWVCA